MSLFAYCDNFLSESLISPSSQVAVGVVPQIEKFAAGSARLELQGVYTASQNRDYVIFISYADTATGTFRYDWFDDGGVTPQAVDVVIVANVWQNLNHGVQIRFVAGTYTPQLVYADRFRFHVERPYRPALGVDLNRETEIRSGAIAGAGTYIQTYPFTGAVSPRALILFDHNIASNATIRVQASTTSDFAATPYNEVATWASGKILFRIAEGTTYRYWRLHITVVGAVDYLAMSEVYLGGELAFVREFDIGFRRVQSLMGGSDASILIRGQGRYGLQPERYELSFMGRNTADDLTTIRTLWTQTHPTSGSQKPFFLYFDSVSTLPIFELFHLDGDMPENHLALDRMSPSWSLLKVIRTAA